MENTETELLTLDKLKSMDPGAIIASGEIDNSPEGLYMTDSDVGRKLLWIAKRGAVHDWTIYVHWADRGFGFVLSNGDKVTSPKNIRMLVPCEDQAFNMYRY